MYTMHQLGKFCCLQFDLGKYDYESFVFSSILL